MLGIKWTTEKRKISTLAPHENNPRKLSEEQKDALTASLKRFGLVEIPAINKDNTILAGHQRVKVLAMIGKQDEEIDVRVPDRQLTKDESREYLIRSNQNTGAWDWAILQESFLKDELLTWGFTEEDLHGRFKNKTEGDDDAPGLPGTSKSAMGDVYDLGPHRLVCGDSTSQSFMDKLFKGQSADMIFTDPPYNVNYKGRGKDTSRTIENDNMDEASFRTFLLAAFDRMSHNTKPSAPLYCCYASRTHREFEDAINQAGYLVRNQIIWVKTVASMGWGDYRWKHEPMFYAVKQGQSTEFFAGRSEWTAWDHEPTDQEKIEIVNRMMKKEEDGKSTVWRFSREFNYVHPTQKPVALITRAIENSSKTHGIVLDPFGGSGSTLIACEKTGRVARTMEFDPTFADVIVQRYADFCKKNDRQWCVIKNGEDISAVYGQEC